MVAGDTQALDALLAADLVHIHANGRADDKAAYLAAIARTPDAYRRVDRLEATARTTAEAGWITGVQELDIHRDGRRTLARLRFLSVWIRERGEWRMTGFCTTRLPAP